MWQDLHYALRTFRRNPGFVIVTALSLALGIGGNAAMFSIVNTLMIRPLPYREPSRLMRVTGVYPKAGQVLFRERSRTMDIASATPGAEMNLVRGGASIRVVGSSVSDNLFDVLGAGAERGRIFTAGEQRPGADRTVILSHALWAGAFASDPHVVGTMVTIGGVGRQVVGVMPASFSFPSSRAQFWIPAKLDASDFADYWGSEYVPFVARLRTGATREQAAAEVRAMMADLRAAFPFPMPKNFNADATAIPLQSDLVGNIRGKLLVLFAAVGMVLLIACANVANLLLARSAVRRKEIALRAALGAARTRIVRQLLTESVTLAMLGAVAGLLLASIGLSIFKSVLPPDTPGLAAIGVDWQAAGFVAALALVTGLGFGVLPALTQSQVDLTQAMKTGSARSTTRHAARVRGLLVAGEIGMTVLLLICAGLLLKSLYAMSRVNPGYRAERVLTMRVSPEESYCSQRQSCIALYDRLVQRARDVSGTTEAAAANTVPLDGTLPSQPVEVQDHPRTPDFPSPMFWTGAVTPAYFDMLRIPVLAGRGFTTADSATSGPVVVITASTARRFWPAESAIGKHVKPVNAKQWSTVVGVVADVHQFNLAGAAPDSISGAMYMPYPQSTLGDSRIPAAMNVLLRTSSASSMVAGELRQIARELNPNAPVGNVVALEEMASESTADFRSTIWVFLSFAAAAVVLAAVGIYGLVSNAVAQRTYEIGLRIAVGATRGQILRLMLGQSVRLALAGIAGGVVAALILTRFLAGLLYGVGVADPLTFAGVCAMILGVAVLASSAPAWRAANIDPIRSLRSE